VEREALEPAFPALRLDRDTPRRVVDVHIERDGLAVVTHAVQRPAHVVHEQAPRAGLIDEQHHACGHARDVGKRGELARPDADDTFGRGDRLGKRVVRLARRERRGRPLRLRQSRRGDERGHEKRRKNQSRNTFHDDFSSSGRAGQSMPAAPRP
jgi:hypothetical protein